ncbi:MAG: ABC transporter ATP-binding protein [Pseudomonadota bacterium]
MHTVIKTDNLGKHYIIDHQRRRQSRTFRASFMPTMRGMLQRMRHPLIPNNAERTETFWAIRNINLAVRDGERMGIIGRNGAGKSTLLKILSRITDPTVGRVRIKGRVASLLEVGTGFHPELTGRENIFLNGAILGMSRVEIKKRFDEIVAFSEIERFLDTPVKHYSSGMYVRLAFAVAAHLEPEILLVDEVLAVGDIAFQKKCLGRMNEVAEEGRTILFVSHNIAAISRLCNRAILLDQGSILEQGNTEHVIAQYLAQGNISSGLARFDMPGNRIAWIDEVGIINADGVFSPTVAVNKDFYIYVQCTTKVRIDLAQIAVSVVTIDGMPVFVTAHSDTMGDDDLTLLPQTYRARIRIPANLLNTGTYSITIHIWGQREGDARASQASVLQALNFTVEETGSVASRFRDGRQGVITPLLEWSFE